ncbi:hypothetical protein K1719_031610 [Acacia pycnantha]|nr:hypothetical protein K1719_031610 [Acacia pycnantha]
MVNQKSDLEQQQEGIGKAHTRVGEVEWLGCIMKCHLGVKHQSNEESTVRVISLKSSEVSDNTKCPNLHLRRCNIKGLKQDISNREGLASEGDWYHRCYNSSIMPIKHVLEARPDLCLLAEYPSEGSNRQEDGQEASYVIFEESSDEIDLLTL